MVYDYRDCASLAVQNKEQKSHCLPQAAASLEEVAFHAKGDKINYLHTLACIYILNFLMGTFVGALYKIWAIPIKGSFKVVKPSFLLEDLLAAHNQAMQDRILVNGEMSLSQIHKGLGVQRSEKV